MIRSTTKRQKEPPKPKPTCEAVHHQWSLNDRRLPENTANQSARTPRWPQDCQHSVLLWTRDINQMGGLFVLQQQCKTRAGPLQLNYRLPVTIDRQHGYCGNAATHLFGWQAQEGWQALETVAYSLFAPDIPISAWNARIRTCSRSQDMPDGPVCYIPSSESVER